MDDKTINILYLSYDGMTDPLGQSQVLPYLTRLSEKGFSFHLISFEKKEKFQNQKEKIQSICDQAKIYWHPLSYTKKPPLLSTVYDVQRMQHFAINLHKKVNFSAVHCRSYIAALIGLKLKKKFNIPFLFDMRGFWADERVEGQIWSLSNPVFKLVYNYFKKKEKLFFLESSHIISLTESGKREIFKMLPVLQKDKVSVIPCCVDLSKFNPELINLEDLQKLKVDLGIETTDKVLGYVGSIGTWYRLSEMLDYYKVFCIYHPNSKFLFVTAENDKLIKDLAIEKQISISNLIIKSCQHDEVPKFISLFDYSIFFILSTFSKTASSPTKLAELMAMGIPVICNSGVGDTEIIINQNNAGSVIESLNEAAFNEQLNVPLSYSKEQVIQSARASFGVSTGVAIYESAYHKILL